MSLTTSPAPAQIPVTVLTGYLGAGKTTLLNRILSENHGKKYAVVINEFGELGVDNDLIIDADEEVLEMNNGCIWCTVRGDLIRIVSQLVKRKGQLDGIIIETTGLADPSPVAQTFFVDDQVKTRSRLDAIVTVVDAKHLLARLEDSHEAEEQVAFADVIVLNKTNRPGARFGFVAFVTGTLDPVSERRSFQALLAPPPAPTLLLCGASTPPKSKAEMAAIPSGPKVRVQWVAGSLGLYEERAVSITAPIATFLAERA